MISDLQNYESYFALLPRDIIQIRITGNPTQSKHASDESFRIYTVYTVHLICVYARYCGRETEGYRVSILPALPTISLRRESSRKARVTSFTTNLLV